MHIEKQQEDFYWLNEESKTFLSRGYIPDGMTVQQRYRQIADAAENILKISGFSDKFYNYLAKGYYSLSSPIIANFGLKRALPISCVTGDTWINTANGGKMAKDIQIGDMVLTHKNRYRKVVNVIPTKEKGDIYKLKVHTRQTDLFITGNHLVLTNLGWVPVEELDPNTHLIATNGEVEYTPENKIIDLKEYVPYNFIVENGFIKKAIERNGRGIENNKSDTHVTYFSSISEFVEVDNDLAFALGIWFAEGSISINNNKKPNGVRITLNVKDESTANIWLRIMKNKFGANGSVHKTEIIRNGKLNSWINVNVNSRVVGEFFASFGKGAKYKQLPEWFLNLPKKLLETFWAAFSGMDGTYRNGNIKVTLSNPVLVMQLYAIGLKLGYRLSLQMKDKPGKFSTTPYVYTLNRRLTDKSRQRSGVKFNDGLVYCPIMHIEKTAKVEDVYDFTVEEDHSFSCAGVVVHNCFGSYITDDINGIFDTISEVAVMNKLGGGTSGYFGAIRARGSEITAGGKSNGTFSFLQIFDKVVSVVNQNGIRRGMFAGYIDIDHADIDEWVDIHTEGNPVQDIYWGVNVTNKFIEKVKNGDKAARNLWAKILSVKTATGIPYLHFIDNVNENKADVYLDKNMKIHASNMCVSGDTRILTKEYGYVEISTKVGEKVTVWNGEEWSENVELVKTGENQKLYRVKLSNGRSIDATAYHKWYVQDGYVSDGGEVVKLQTSELKEGMKLEKFKLPVIDGSNTLDNAYTNGFFSADGCHHANVNIIYLYGEKKKLRQYLTGEVHRESTTTVNDKNGSDRITVGIRNLQRKFFVPDITYSVKSRLEWLAGYLDGDGCVYRNGDSEQLTAASVNLDFLMDLQDMLQTLGIKSKITKLRDEGEYLLPANDGTGELKPYMCKQTYRLLINCAGTKSLFDLGIPLKRLKLKGNVPNRNASRFVTVVSIEEVEGEHDTFCCHEPKRNKVMFNGVMTGNCMEISLPSSKDESFVCCLMSMNLLHYDQWKDTDAVKTAVYFLDAVMSEFIEKARVIPKMEKAVRFAERHRALGLGVLGWHSYLQSQMIPFDGFEAMMKNAEIFKHIREESYQGSKELAELLGEPELLKGYGRRNTTLMAIAPTKSSSFILGQVSQGVEPIKANLFIKDTAKVKTVFKNPFLQKLLAERDQDTPEVWESINKAGGSVAHLSFLTPREKEVFKTFEEINQMSIIQQAAQRQKFIDQGQSINLSIHPETPLKDINALYLQAMELGVKGIYYQFSKSAAQSFNRELLQCSACEA